MYVWSTPKNTLSWLILKKSHLLPRQLSLRAEQQALLLSWNEPSLRPAFTSWLNHLKAALQRPRSRLLCDCNGGGCLFVLRPRKSRLPRRTPFTNKNYARPSNTILYSTVYCSTSFRKWASIEDECPERRL